MEAALDIIQTLIAVLIAITFHEFAHGYASYKMGDPTPKETGRLSLNPFRHLDFFGTICLMVVHFGWAKPVQVNPYYYKNRKRGMVLVALAGPMMNFLIMIISIFMMSLILKLTGGYAGDFIIFVFNVFSSLAVINLSLGVFNLIPIPPLDGSKILGAVLPEDKYFGYMRFERFGYLILVVALYFDLLRAPLDAVITGIYNVIWYMVNFLVGM